MATDLPSEEVILARFHRLRITINLSATRFGYMSVGQPSLIRRLEEGHGLRAKTKRAVVHCLDELEREHSTPLPVNEAGTKLDAKENIPNNMHIHSEMEE